jgi:hypothetical protein
MTVPSRAAAPPERAVTSASAQLLDRSNLVAWCIVPFDAKKRGPADRAEMLQRLGLRLFAYDYRAEHIPTFDAEIEALKQRGITLLAWWFPTVLNDEAKLILDKLRRHNVRAQLWVTGGGGPTRNEVEQTERVESEAERIRPIAEAAAAIGCTVALYNHGGWFGDPFNQIAIIERLRSGGIDNVSIVYNLHTGTMTGALSRADAPHETVPGRPESQRYGGRRRKDRTQNHAHRPG